MKLEWRKYVIINIFFGISRYNIWVWCIEIYHFFSNFIFIHTDKRKMKLFLRTTVYLWWLCLGDFCISISLLILFLNLLYCYILESFRVTLPERKGCTVLQLVLLESAGLMNLNTFFSKILKLAEFRILWFIQFNDNWHKVVIFEKVNCGSFGYFDYFR